MRSQGGKYPELAAATALARLSQQQGKRWICSRRAAIEPRAVGIVDRGEIGLLLALVGFVTISPSTRHLRCWRRCTIMARFSILPVQIDPDTPRTLSALQSLTIQQEPPSARKLGGLQRPSRRYSATRRGHALVQAERCVPNSMLAT